MKNTTPYYIMIKPTLYELLEVRNTASPEVIHAAYRAKIARAHPDKASSGNLAYRLNEAKETLLNLEKREKYDREIGKIIGSYRVIREIGQGAFGKTYEANHLLLEEKACLKQALDMSEDNLNLLRREAKLLWNIHHHSLPTLRDFYELGNGSCVLAMSYIEGPSLDKIVTKLNKIEPEDVCWMSQRLLNALHYLHFHGLVHCDVKPNNIIIKPEEHNAVLVDFGLACLKPQQKTTPEGYTEAFAAPEIIALKPPIPASDLYSLGLTMVYALGGNPLKKIYPKSVPEKIKTFFDQFLIENPTKRPSWENKDIIGELSKIRMEVFGRTSSNKKFEI